MFRFSLAIKLDDVVFFCISISKYDIDHGMRKFWSSRFFCCQSLLFYLMNYKSQANDIIPKSYRVDTGFVLVFVFAMITVHLILGYFIQKPELTKHVFSTRILNRELLIGALSVAESGSRVQRADVSRAIPIAKQYWC